MKRNRYIAVSLALVLFFVSLIKAPDIKAQAGAVEYDFENMDVGTAVASAASNMDTNPWYFSQLDIPLQKAVVAQDPAFEGNKCMKFYTDSTNSAALVCNAVNGKTIDDVVLEFKFKVIDQNPKIIPGINTSSGTTILKGTTTDLSNNMGGTGSGQKIPYIANTWNTYKFVLYTSGGKKYYSVYINNDAVAFLKAIEYTTNDTALKNFYFQIQANQAGSPIYIDDVRVYNSANTSIIHPAVPDITGEALWPNASINLSTSTAGANIYYTTDGSTPNTSSPKFTPGGTNPILLDGEGKTIRTVSEKNGVFSIVATYGPYNYKRPKVWNFESDSLGASYGGTGNDWTFDGSKGGVAQVVKDPLDSNGQCLKISSSDPNTLLLRQYLDTPFKYGDFIISYKLFADNISQNGYRQGLILSGKNSAGGTSLTDYIAPYYNKDGTMTIGGTKAAQYDTAHWIKYKFVIHVGQSTTYSLYVDDSASPANGFSNVAISNFKEIGRIGFLISTSMADSPLYIDDIGLYYQAYQDPTVLADIKQGQVESGTKITLASNVSGARIYYTLDGSKPTKTSNVYEEPIALNSYNTILRAAAEGNGIFGTPVAFGSYTIRTIQNMTCTNNIFKVDGTQKKSMAQIKAGDKVINEVTVYHQDSTAKDFTVVFGLYKGDTLEAINFKKYTTTGAYTTVDLDFDIPNINIAGMKLISYVWNDADEAVPIAQQMELK